jgi:uncharacterized protein
MIDDQFEWDDDKASSNLANHKVAFEDARRAFQDAFAISRADRREDYGEDRYLLLGIAIDRLLVVAYTLRGERIRIISARIAEPRERRRYHEANTQD